MYVQSRLNERTMKNKDTGYNVDHWERKLERVFTQMYSSGLIENEYENMFYRNVNTHEMDFFNGMLRNTLKQLVEMKNAKKYRKRSEKHFIFRQNENLFGWKSVPFESCRHYVQNEEVECDCQILCINFHSNYSFFKNGKFTMVKIEHDERYPGQDFICHRTYNGLGFNIWNGYVTPLEKGIFTQVILNLDRFQIYKNEIACFFRSLFIILNESSIIPKGVLKFITLKSRIFQIRFYFMSEIWIDPLIMNISRLNHYLSGQRLRKIYLNKNSSRIFLEEEIFQRENFKAKQFIARILKAVEEKKRKKIL